MVEYMYVLQHYAVFSGRASRREYWMFQLFNVIISFLIGFFGVMLLGASESQLSGANLLTNLYALAVMIPSYAVAIRRMHDTNKSGWCILVPIYSLYLALKAGDKQSNTYGPDPYSTDDHTDVEPDQFTPLSPKS
jgi:uncharacterized membrane protein YhaH (DUF805 family)